ncbi:MAG TPA: MopE-related protein, partial [Anaeromyxobacteraceae bacterium]|nr:MopE-related protein [Anaeromyxobacteraceae bacterium]
APAEDPCTPSPELCDGLDQDCNGLVDDGVPGCCAPGAQEACGAAVGACAAGTRTCTADRAWGDCLDGLGSPVRLPGTVPEECNGVDDDCDGKVDGDGVPVSTLCPLAPNAVGSVCGGVTGCSVGTCEAGWYDANQLFSDGCECQADTVPDFCAGALNMASLAAAGNLVPATDVDWYAFTLPYAFSPTTWLVKLLGGDGSATLCVVRTCGGVESCGTTVPVVVSGLSTVRVRVQASSPPTTCAPYAVQVVRQ